MFTRREILKAFLGIGLAASACRKPNSIGEIDGSIVGASAEIGHLLRDQRKFEVADDAWYEKDAIIIGSGIAGLSAAWRFKKNGFDNFEILELEPRFGGTSASEKGSPVSYPWGAHYLPVPLKENEDLVELLEEMSLIESFDNHGDPVIFEQFLVRDPEERIFYDGRWFEGLYVNAGATREDKRQLVSFQKEIDFWINWRDASGKRAFVVPVENCSADAEVTQLDRISFAQWLDAKGFTSKRLRWLCDYSCRDDYGLQLEQTSAWAGLFYFCSRVRSSGEESQSFITFPEGNGRFVNYFLSKVSANIKANSLVVEIIPGEKITEIVCFDTKKQEIFGIKVRHVIFAAPLFTSQYIIRGFRENLPFNPNSFAHNSWFVANLFLKERPANTFTRDFPLAWDNVIYESPSLGYITATHQLGIDYGKTILTYYYPMATSDLRAGREKLFSLDWREIADIILSDLSVPHKNIREATEKIDIMRWGHAMISPQTGFLFGGEREKASAPYRNIYFAHSDLGGIAIFEEAFYHGLRAANAIVDKHGK